MGNNEDFFNPDTKVWFVPGRGGEIGEMSFGSGHGRVYFGHTTYPHGGMNNQGLFFDMVSVEPVELLPQEGRPVFKGDALDAFMSECATVEDVLGFFNSYSFPGKCGALIFVGDSTGTSSIIRPIADGCLSFARKEGEFQIAPEEDTCERSQIAAAMLEDSEGISIDLFRRILAAVHQEVPAPTLYSNIYDLKRRQSTCITSTISRT